MEIFQGFPLLENGDCMPDDEFLRRYEQMPGVKAELIDGVVYMASPVSAELHGMPHNDLQHALSHYRIFMSKVRATDNSTVKLGKKNIPQPDIGLFINSPEGQARIVDGYLVGAPELVAEISASTRSVDVNQKFETYQKAGVKEYLVWRVEDDEIDWWQLVNGKYERLREDDAGVIRSVVYPGLWLNVPELISANMPAVLATIDAGRNTPEYKSFAAVHSG